MDTTRKHIQSSGSALQNISPGQLADARHLIPTYARTITGGDVDSLDPSLDRNRAVSASCRYIRRRCTNRSCIQAAAGLCLDAATQPMKGRGDFMERFVSDQSVKHYRQLASGTLTAAQRRTLFTLLSEEIVKYRDLSRPPLTKPIQ